MLSTSWITIQLIMMTSTFTQSIIPQVLLANGHLKYSTSLTAVIPLLKRKTAQKFPVPLACSPKVFPVSKVFLTFSPSFKKI